MGKKELYPLAAEYPEPGEGPAVASVRRREPLALA